eukprot:344871_1
MSSPKFERVRSGYVDGDSGIVATVDIKKGEVILDLNNAMIVGEKMRWNTQIGLSKFLFYTHPDFKYQNHSCNPNIYLDIPKMQTIALKDITSGTELTRNYCANNWICYKSFKCICGSYNCFKDVGGAKYCTLAQLFEMEHILAPYIKEHVLDTAKKLAKL